MAPKASKVRRVAGALLLLDASLQTQSARTRYGAKFPFQATEQQTASLAKGVESSAGPCCPGIHATDFMTYPCPRTERKDFWQCQLGAQGLVKALLSGLSREQKYKFLHGEITGKLQYIGEAALNEPLDIPGINMQDSGNGFRTDHRKVIGEVTSWPVALTVAASWGEDEMGRYAAAIGREAHDKGANMILGPAVNVHRVPGAGRNAEYISGESPYLGVRLVKPYVMALQSQRVLGCVKHFVNNNQETWRDNVNVIVDDRTEFEVYFRPFQAAIDAGVASVMCSYNSVNGWNACDNGRVLQVDLKNQMGFKGWVMSEWLAVHDSDDVFVGVDQEMPGYNQKVLENLEKQYGKNVTKAHFTKETLASMPVAELDQKVGAQLEMMINNGLFEPAGRVCTGEDCDKQHLATVATNPEHQALARELATKGVLLLKNENNVLPIKRGTKKIALLGEACSAPQDVESQLKDWTKGSYYNIGGSGRVIADDPVSIREGLEAKCIEYGCEIIGEYSGDVAKSVYTASQADVAIICGGTTSTETRDRTTLSVDQESYMVGVATGFRALKIPGSRLVSITLTPGAIILPWANMTDGILNLFMAGKYTGTALADVVFGEVNPSAKSPVSFPLNDDQVIWPCQPDKEFGDRLKKSKEAKFDCVYEEGMNVGFLALQDKQVAFPFGHGLSYTSFLYEPALIVKPFKEAVMTEKAMDEFPWATPDNCKGAMACVKVKVTNTGSRAGVEVPQMYLTWPTDEFSKEYTVACEYGWNGTLRMCNRPQEGHCIGKVRMGRPDYADAPRNVWTPWVQVDGWFNCTMSSIFAPFSDPAPNMGKLCQCTGMIKNIIGEPKKQLRGFQRMPELLPGASSVVGFPLFEEELKIRSAMGTWDVPAGGAYKVHIGSSSRDIRFETNFSICADEVSAQPWNGCWAFIG